MNLVKLTLNFIEECTYNKSKAMQKRLREVIETISEFVIPNSKDKSWFWKFRHVLYEIEAICLENKINNHFELEKILNFYYIIGDTLHMNST